MTKQPSPARGRNPRAGRPSGNGRSAPVRPAAARQGQRRPAQSHQHFLNLARDALSRGDLIEAENCYQHAEHYFRLAREGET